MQSENRVIHVVAIGMILLSVLSFFSKAALAQDVTTTSRTLLVGTIVSPPLFTKAAGNQWEGFSVELWRAVAHQMDVTFEFREFGTLELLLDALEKKEIDVIPSLPVRERFETKMDFSQSYLKTGLSIAVPSESGEYSWLRVFEGLFSGAVFKAIGILVLMSLIAGVLVWSFERQRNQEMFGNGTAAGIGNGVWWAMVTMSTVGYGDKAPKTIGGRIVALMWMIFSIIFIASFTANITTALTVREIKGKVRAFSDLYNARVGSIPNSEAFDYLAKHGIAVTPYEGIKEGLLAVADKKIDAFVLNEHILKHWVKNELPGRVQVLPGTFDEYFSAIALQQGSLLREPINIAMLHFMKTPNWKELMDRYFK